MKIAIFGLGYVGSVSAACFCDLGHEVIGVDINSLKVYMINQGKNPVVEPGLQLLIKKYVEQGRLRLLRTFERRLSLQMFLWFAWAPRV